MHPTIITPQQLVQQQLNTSTHQRANTVIGTYTSTHQHDTVTTTVINTSTPQHTN
jgi:hypothetical protein